MSRDSVRITLTLAALNSLDLQTADVHNAYLSAKPKERVYFYAVSEFGKDEGKLGIVVRALYGITGAGNAWSAEIHQCMRNLGFTPCVADGDVWVREAVDNSKLELNDHTRSDNHASDNKDDYTLKTDKCFLTGEMYW